MNEPMPSPLKCGVAGVGYLGKHHARLYNALEGAQLVGIFEPTMRRPMRSVPIMDAQGI